MNHLSDEQIQKYLDKNNSLNRTDIEKHLKTCDSCQKNLMIYKQLYSGLTDETGFMLSANFSESVVSRIKKKEEKSKNFFEGLLLVIAGLFSVGLLFYFTNLGKVLLSVFQKNSAELKPFIVGIGNIFGSNLILILFAIIILLLFGLADKLILQTKHH
jgi:hypothetical protein